MQAEDKFKKAMKLKELMEQYQLQLQLISGEFTAICAKKPEQVFTTMGKSVALKDSKMWLGRIKEYTENKILSLQSEFNELMK